MNNKKIADLIKLSKIAIANDDWFNNKLKNLAEPPTFEECFKIISDEQAIDFIAKNVLLTLEHYFVVGEMDEVCKRYGITSFIKKENEQEKEKNIADYTTLPDDDFNLPF